MRILKAVFTFLITLNLCGCFVTSSVINDFGVKRGNIDSVTRLSDAGDDYAVEFHAKHYLYQSRDMFFWKRVSRESLFAHPEYDAVGVKLKPGHLPDKAGDNAISRPECVTIQNMQDWIVITDDCARKTTRIKTRKEYAYKSNWRPVLLPVLVPVACVADVLISPILVGYFVKCAAFGCAK